MRRILFCLATTVLPSLACAQQIYVGQSNESGAIVLSSFASRDANVVLMRTMPKESGVGAGTSGDRSGVARPPRPVSPELHRIIEAAASRSTLSPLLLHAVINAESNYEPRAVSPRGAIGLMQLLPDTAKRFGAQDPFDPQQNVAAGAAYLKWLMAFFDEDLELALAGYNAGEQAVLRAGRKVPPYAETQAYVKKVTTAFRRATAVAL